MVLKFIDYFQMLSLTAMKLHSMLASMGYNSRGFSGRDPLMLRRFVRMATTYSSATPGPIELSICQKVTDALNPSHLKVANDSKKHAHHEGMVGADNVKESHFRLEIVLDKFQGLNLPARHRLVYGLLDDEFQNKGLHALQLKTKTPTEWDK